MSGPRVVCACCGIEIPIGYPVCPDCFGAIEPKHCLLCAYGNKPRGGLHYNERGGYVGKCAAEVAS